MKTQSNKRNLGYDIDLFSFEQNHVKFFMLLKAKVEGAVSITSSYIIYKVNLSKLIKRIDGWIEYLKTKKKTNKNILLFMFYICLLFTFPVALVSGNIIFGHTRLITPFTIFFLYLFVVTVSCNCFSSKSYGFTKLVLVVSVVLFFSIRAK